MRLATFLKVQGGRATTGTRASSTGSASRGRATAPPPPVAHANAAMTIMKTAMGAEMMTTSVVVRTTVAPGRAESFGVAPALLETGGMGMVGMKTSVVTTRGGATTAAGIAMTAAMGVAGRKEPLPLLSAWRRWCRPLGWEAPLSLMWRWRRPRRLAVADRKSVV